MIEDQDVRAVRGGTGYAKCGGNYAASNRAGEKAEERAEGPASFQTAFLDALYQATPEDVGAQPFMLETVGK